MGEPMYARMRRWHHADSGSVLLEAVVAVMVVSVVMVAVTAVLITGTQSSARQRNAQAAVQIATSALDQAQALDSLSAIPAGLPARTVNNTAFTTEYSVCYLAGADAADCTGDASLPLARVTASVTWADRTCAGGECRYTSTTLVSNRQGWSKRPATPPGISLPGRLDSTNGRPVDVTPAVATGVLAPPVIFSGTLRPLASATDPCAPDMSTGSQLAPSDGTSTNGLSLDPATGAFSGRPRSSGVYCISASVHDAAQGSAQTSATWVVSDLVCHAPSSLYYGSPGGEDDPSYVGNTVNKVSIRQIRDCIDDAISYVVVTTGAYRTPQPDGGELGPQPMDPAVICPVYLGPQYACGGDGLFLKVPYAPATYCFAIEATMADGSQTSFHIAWPFLLDAGDAPLPAPAPCDVT